MGLRRDHFSSSFLSHCFNGLQVSFHQLSFTHFSQVLGMKPMYYVPVTKAFPAPMSICKSSTVGITYFRITMDSHGQQGLLEHDRIPPNKINLNACVVYCKIMLFYIKNHVEHHFLQIPSCSISESSTLNRLKAPPSDQQQDLRDVTFLGGQQHWMLYWLYCCPGCTSSKSLWWMYPNVSLVYLFFFAGGAGGCLFHARNDKVCRYGTIILRCIDYPMKTYEKLSPCEADPIAALFWLHILEFFFQCQPSRIFMTFTHFFPEAEVPVAGVAGGRSSFFHFRWGQWQS